MKQTFTHHDLPQQANPQVVYVHDTVTTERTSKLWKLLMLGGFLFFILGLVGIAITHERGLADWMYAAHGSYAVGGLLVLMIAKVLAWWNNG